MSDYKREKLREYLINNKYKSKINLDNNSDNKEKSNKSLENDLNFDNSNLNNKTNSNKRDYEKEPIILKNYNAGNLLSYFLITMIFCGTFIKIMYEYGAINFYYGGRTYLTYHENSTFITYTLMEFIVAIYFYRKKENDIVINDLYITYIGNYNSNGISIENINKTNFIKENYNVKINIIILCLCIFSSLGSSILEIIIFIISYSFIRFFPIFLFSIKQNKSFSFYNPGYLYVKTKYHKEIIPLVSKNDTKEVKKYFLEKLNIDITDKINYFL